MDIFPNSANKTLNFFSSKPYFWAKNNFKKGEKGGGGDFYRKYNPLKERLLILTYNGE